MINIEIAKIESMKSSIGILSLSEKQVLERLEELYWVAYSEARKSTVKECADICQKTWRTRKENIDFAQYYCQEVERKILALIT